MYLTPKFYNTCIPWKYMDRVKRIWYLSPMRAAKVQASLRIRAVSPEPSLLAHTSSESRGTFRQKSRPLAPLNGWTCAVEICHDGMLEDTNSLDGAHIRDTVRAHLKLPCYKLKTWLLIECQGARSSFLSVSHGANSILYLCLSWVDNILKPNYSVAPVPCPHLIWICFDSGIGWTMVIKGFHYLYLWL